MRGGSSVVILKMQRVDAVAEREQRRGRTRNSRKRLLFTRRFLDREAKDVTLTCIRVLEYSFLSHIRPNDADSNARFPNYLKRTN